MTCQRLWFVSPLVLSSVLVKKTRLVLCFDSLRASLAHLASILRSKNNNNTFLNWFVAAPEAIFQSSLRGCCSSHHIIL